MVVCRHLGRPAAGLVAERVERLARTIFGDLAGLGSNARAHGQAHGHGANQPTGLHGILASIAACPAAGPGALQPKPPLNHALGRLVAIMQHRFESALGMARPLDEAERAAIAQGLVERITAEPALMAMARELRLICGEAERQLELHWCRRLLQSWPAQAAASGAASALPPAARLDRLCRLLAGFPYLDNYQHIVDGEIRLLQRAHTRRQGEGRFDAWRVAFCGSGALPLSGLMLQLRLGVPVTLIDRDPEATRLSRRLIAALEQQAVLLPGRIEVVERDAAQVWGAAAPPGGRRRHWDLVVLASLLDDATRARIAAALPDGPPGHLLIRSAIGLTGLLGYPPADLAPMGALGWRFGGAAVPAAQPTMTAKLLGIPLNSADKCDEFENRMRASAAGSPAEPWLMRSDHSVLNTSLVFHSAAHGAGPSEHQP